MISASRRLLAVLAIGCLVGCGRSSEAQRGDPAAATPIRAPTVLPGTNSSVPQLGDCRVQHGQLTKHRFITIS